MAIRKFWMQTVTSKMCLDPGLARFIISSRESLTELPSLPKKKGVDGSSTNSVRCTTTETVSVVTFSGLLCAVKPWHSPVRKAGN